MRGDKNMGVFETIFRKPKADLKAEGYFKMLNGYTPVFSNAPESIYEMELTRAAIHSFASFASKLKPEISGTAQKNLERTLQFKPNPFMDTSKFIYRIATILSVNNTCFIVPIEDEFGGLIGYYPLLPQRCEVIEYTPEYRSAWLKNIAVRSGISLLGDMSAEERAAFTATTANSAAVVPPATLNMIIDLVESMSPMLEDAEHSGMTSGFGVPRRKSIKAGDAKGVAEGTANDDEENEFDLLSLEGIEIKKHAVLSRKMKFKSIDAFEAWLVNELAERIAVAKNRVIRNRLDGVAPDGGSAIAGAGIATANILTGQKYTDAAIRGMFALLKGKGERVIYANNKTIWNNLAGIEDGNKNKLFVPNSMVDPITAGRIYGASVKVDNEIADNVIYLGTKGQVIANDYDELEIFSAIEPKTANEVKTAYSLFDAGLKNPESFVKATFVTA